MTLTRLAMKQESLDDSSEDNDIKPIVLPGPSTTNSSSVAGSSTGIGLSPNLASGSKKWSPGSWQDGNRKSAFLPYKPTLCTVLTNLQRGNIQAESRVPQAADLNFHTRAGQGREKHNCL